MIDRQSAIRRTTFGMLTIAALLQLSATATAEFNGQVLAVVDGDTIEVLDETSTQVSLRLSGIDAPDTGQPYSVASSQHLDMLLAGKAVKVSNTRPDRLGRLCGTVTVNGKDAGFEQLSAGMARWDRYDRKNQGSQEQAELRAAEAEAKRNKRGLWSGDARE